MNDLNSTIELVQKLTTIKDALDFNIGSGKTVWLLKGAILNPRVLIVCASKVHALTMKETFKQVCKEDPNGKKVIEEQEKTGYPMFVPLDNLIETCRLTHSNDPTNKVPIIFDSFIFNALL